VAADQVGDAGRGAAIVHRREFRPSHPLDEDNVEMSARADAEGPVVDLPGVFLRELDELADGSCRQRRMHDQRLRADTERSDRNEIVERIVRELAVDVRRRDEGRVRGHQQGVAVRRRLRDIFSADLAGAATRLVLDHDLLAEGFRQPLAQRAADHIGDAACGKRHDDMNGPARIGLRRRGRGTKRTPRR
jgi:hypothetical protein